MLNLKTLRDDDFLKCRRRILREWPPGRPVTVKAVAAATVASGAPRYYVSHLRASRVIARLRHGHTVGKPGSILAAQWDEILSKVDRLRARHPWLNDDRAVARVLAFERASRFFISEGYAVRLSQSIIRDRRHCRHRRGGSPATNPLS
ncbi:MAG: hypothetical protein NC117_00645 [Pseudoflavonifractor sp.]|nr:hypothetical protein [Pseudoflavonifractor sp.]